MRAPRYKGWRLVWRTPGGTSRAEQEDALDKLMRADEHAWAIGHETKTVGWYDELLLYVSNASLLRVGKP